MICRVCGFENEEASKFCRKCGANLLGNADGGFADADNSVQNEPSAARASDNFAGFQQRKFSPSDVIAVAKSSARSVPVLIAAILAMISFGINVYTSFVQVDLMSYFPGSEFAGIAYMLAAVMLIPSFLLCIACWLVYASGHKKTPPMSTAGLTIIKGVMIVYLVIVCIALAVFAAAMVIGMFSIMVAEAEYSSAVSPIFAGVFLAGIAMFILTIIYYAKVISTVNSAKFTIRTGTPNCRISMYVAVMNFIYAGFGALNGIVYSDMMSEFLGLGKFFLYESYYERQCMLAAAGAICSAVSMVLFTIVLISYRSKMKSMAYVNAGLYR